MAQTLSTSPQFDSMVIKEKHRQIEDGCLRCGGMLVDDQCYDLSSSGMLKLAINRCIQCGDVTDSVILQHRDGQALSCHSTM